MNLYRGNERFRAIIYTMIMRAIRVQVHYEPRVKTTVISSDNSELY